MWSSHFCWLGTYIAVAQLSLFQSAVYAARSGNSVHDKSANLPLPVNTFYTFPSTIFPENIYPRKNGQLLVTTNTAPTLLQVDPSKNQSSIAVHTFDGFTSLFGIGPSAEDLYYVAVGNFSGPPNYTGTKGSWAIWQVDLRGIDVPSDKQPAKVRQVAELPDAVLLDGFDSLSKARETFVIGDATAGVLYKIDAKTGAVSPLLQDNLLNGTSIEDSAGLAHVGINGLKVRLSDVFFTNTAKQFYGKMPIDRSSGRLLGPIEQVFNYSTILDDFNFDAAGNAFLAQPLLGIFLRPTTAHIHQNDSTLFASLYGVNSCAFGRSVKDRCTLYATFDGAPPGLASIDASAAGFCGANGLSS